jgi:hypothetical protein
MRAGTAGLFLVLALAGRGARADVSATLDVLLGGGTLQSGFFVYESFGGYGAAGLVFPDDALDPAAVVVAATESILTFTGPGGAPLALAGTGFTLLFTVVQPDPTLFTSVAGLRAYGTIGRDTGGPPQLAAALASPGAGLDLSVQGFTPGTPSPLLASQLVGGGNRMPVALRCQAAGTGTLDRLVTAFAVAAVPEPGVLTLAGLAGVLALAWCRLLRGRA